MSKGQFSADVQVYIPGDGVSYLIGEKLVNACGEFMEAMGFEIEALESPVYSSFWQRIAFKLVKKSTRKELGDLYNSGKEALELKYSNLVSAESTSLLANASSSILQSLNDVDEAVVRLGAIIVLKVKINGEIKVIIETLSPRIMRHLDQNPKLLKAPNLLYEYFGNIDLVEDHKGM